MGSRRRLNKILLDFANRIHENKKVWLFTLVTIIIATLLVVFLPKKTEIVNGKKITRYVVIDQIKKNFSKQKEISQEFSLTIKKINVKTPIITGVDPSNKDGYNEALKSGVVHMDGTALPGKNSGNIFIFGHSSALEKGNYDKIFAKLNDLNNKDQILLSYLGKSYNYYVVDKKIVEKTDLSVLNQSTEERLTLMTCWPIGTDKQRLVVIAKRK